MRIIPFLGVAEPISSTVHFVGAVVAAGLASSLARRAHTDPIARRCLWVFTASVVFLLTMSGAYHSLPHGGLSREVLQRLDHAGIFVLIAGTFTAAHGLLFRGLWRRGMIVLMWTLGSVGVAAKVVFFESISESTGLLLYLAMGWLGAVSIVKLVSEKRHRQAAYLWAGGVVYTVGAAGDHLAGSDLTLLPGVLEAHELFHVAVIGGIATHWKLFHDAARAPCTDLLAHVGASTPMPASTAPLPSRVEQSFGVAGGDTI